MSRYNSHYEEICAKERADEHKHEERKIAESEATLRAKALMAVRDRIKIERSLTPAGIIEYTIDGQPKTFYRKPIALCALLEDQGFIDNYRVGEVEQDGVWMPLEDFIRDFTAHQSLLLVAEIETNKAWKEMYKALGI